MSVRHSFNLRDEELREFEERAQHTQANARFRSPDEIVADARVVADAAAKAQLPAFVRDRFARLVLMLDMASDSEWCSSDEDRQRLLNAIACCCDSQSSVDESAGFLDHSIMIELVSRDLEHDLAAYRDFCSLRTSHSKRRRPGANADEQREQWLSQTREALQQRMHLRRTRSLVRSGGSMRRLFSLLGL